MKSLYLSIAVYIAYSTAQLQAQELPKSLSFEEAKQWSLLNSGKFKALQFDAEIASEALKEVQAKSLPQVYADAHMQHNLILPVTPVPANAFDPSIDNGVLRPIRFTSRWTGNMGINAQYDLFNPKKKSQIQEAELQIKLAKKNQDEKKDSYLRDISTAYLEALIAQEQHALAAADTLSKYISARMSQEQFDAGRMDKITLNKVQTQVLEARVTWQEAQRILELAKAKLLYQLGLDPEAAIAFQLTDTLVGLIAQFQLPKDQHVEITAAPDYIQQHYQLKQQLTAVQIQGLKNLYLPTVFLNGYYGANFFDQNFELLKGNNWYGHSFIAVGIRMPIFESWDRFKKINQLKLVQQQDHYVFQDEVYKNKLAYMEARGQVEQSYLHYSTALQGFHLAQENLSLTNEQFQEGRLLISQVYESNYQYAMAKNEYLHAAYAYLLAYINLDYSYKQDSSLTRR